MAKNYRKEYYNIIEPAHRASWVTMKTIAIWPNGINIAGSGGKPKLIIEIGTT